MIKGIIFDLDGVICSTDVYHFEAWKQTMKKLGVNIDQNTMDKLRGVGRVEGFKMMLNDAKITLSEQEIIKYCDEKNELYKNLLNKMSYSDVSDENRAALYKLKEKGIRLAIGSSSKNARLVLEKIGLRDFFDAVSDGNDLKAAKPDPEVFLKAADMIELPPAECFVVEDAESGIDAAKNGGFTAIGISAAAKYERTDYPINSLSEIIGILEKTGTETKI